MSERYMGESLYGIAMYDAWQKEKRIRDVVLSEGVVKGDSGFS